MKKIIVGIFTFVFLLLSASFFRTTTYADPYDCLHFGTQQCIALHASATCSSGKPVVSLSWNNPHNDSSFTIVYSHDGHWYIKLIQTKVLSTTIPPYGGYQDGGSAGDPGFKATGGSFGAKITGGIPGFYGGSGITTGYSTPDATTTMPNCTIPTPTPTPKSPTPTPTNGPTPTPGAPTPTPTGAPATRINIALQLPGIGIGGNLSPKHNTRTLHVSLYAATVDPTQPNVKPVFDSKTQTLTYNSGTGYFTNSGINLGNLATGDYQLLVKVPGYLRKQFTEPNSSTKTIHITGQTTTLVPSIKLIAGDVGPLFNVMDAADFYGIVGCYKDKANASTCAVGSQIADINDDGTVDGIDLNYWLLGFQSLVTNNDPSGTGDGVTGD